MSHRRSIDSSLPPTRSLQVLIIGVALCASLQADPALAQDGKTILQNMITTYRGLNSYQGHANGILRQNLTNGKTVTEDGFTTTLAYQKPNKLRLDFTTPLGGRMVYYDGKTLAYFRNKTQTYSIAPAEIADLRQLCLVLKELHIVSRYDTLYFLAGNGIPANIANIARRPDAAREGRPVYVVSALEKRPSGVFGLTWMIDKQTNMLARVEDRTTHAPKAVNLVNSGRVVVKDARVDRVLIQNIVERTPNVRIDPAKFVFPFPASARRTKFPPEVELTHRRPARIPDRNVKQ